MAWFAMHRHPEKAAMLHVANSRHDDDKIIDKVTGELIDPHYKGKFNPMAEEIKRAAAKEHIGRQSLDDMAEEWASAATSKALHKLEANAGKPWVDHGVSGRGGGLYRKAAAQDSGWIKTQVDSEITGDGRAKGHRPARPAKGADADARGRDNGQGLYLPGLGRADSVVDAAKRLSALAGKAGGKKAGGNDGGGGSSGGGGGGTLGLHPPRHTLHASLSKHGYALPEGRDLSQAPKAGYGIDGRAHGQSGEQGGRGRGDVYGGSDGDGGGGGDGGGDSDGDSGAPEKAGLGESYGALDKQIAREMHSGDAPGVRSWDDPGRRSPVGQSMHDFFSKGNQAWMNAAGAWGAGAR